MKKTFLSLFLLSGLLSASLRGQSIPPSLFTDSHDITSLSPWGPYSKRYVGISHLTDQQRGLRFDFSVMPGYYRNRQLVPHVLFESGYYPWEITPQMDRITYRYELEWKDRVYTDVTYHLLNDSCTLVGIRCVNHTSLPQNLVLNQMAYLAYPETYPQVKAVHAEGLCWYNAVDYVVNEPPQHTPQYHLVYDGWRRNEERTVQSLDGSVLGRGWGRQAGHRLVYEVHLPAGQESGSLLMRFRVARGKVARLQLHGLAEQTVDLMGTGEFAFTSVPYHSTAAGNKQLEIITKGGEAVELDGFYVGTDRSAQSLTISPASLSFTPQMEIGENQRDVLLKYPDSPFYYGVAWNYPHGEIREILNSELESFFRRRVHDHVSRRLVGDRGGHYTNVFLRPVVLQPRSEQTIYLLLCVGRRASVKETLARFHRSPQQYTEDISSSPTAADPLLPGGEQYQLGRQLLQAALLSNVVFPVYTQQSYIRHFTPGKNWNSLYTWDSGFIALGLLDIDPLKAFECIRAYTTSPGSESAFIHHGTPLPIQLFAYAELWNIGCNREALAFLYPRLKQFFDFMTHEQAPTRMAGSGLLQTWDYFYNSGGWDDYPPQKAMHAQRKRYPAVTPVVTSAYYLRAAKILRMAARQLGFEKDIKAYDRTIRHLTQALQTHAWDEASGYYAYVVHDSLGHPQDIFRYRDGSNFNCGMDGVTPLAAGICTADQANRLIGHLFSSDELWTPTGLSTVDRSTPYYIEDGYWNGAVWFPHQWVIWKTLLDLGRGSEAWKVAHTALDVWERECRESYFTFEHFIISSGRGAGWHQFSGLSSPLLNWFAAYYKPGRVSTGFEIQITQGEFQSDYTAYTAQLSFDDSTPPHERCLLIGMNADHAYEVCLNGKPVPCHSPHKGLLEITLPATNRPGKLSVRPRRS